MHAYFKEGVQLCRLESLLKDILENRIKIPKRTRGVYYDFKSRESKALFDTFEIKKYIFNNYFELKRGTSPIISYIEFPKWQTDAFLALQHCTLYRPHITKDGYFDTYVVDYYDFSKRSKKNDPYVWLNNYAYDIQERGGLENYFLVYHIHEKAGIIGEIREWVK